MLQPSDKHVTSGGQHPLTFGHGTYVESAQALVFANRENPLYFPSTFGKFVTASLLDSRDVAEAKVTVINANISARLFMLKVLDLIRNNRVGRII